jgi:hypothetical protein
MFRLMTGALGKPDTRRGQDVLVDARPDRSGSTNQCDRPNLSLTKDYENLLLAKPLRDGRCPVAKLPCVEEAFGFLKELFDPHGGPFSEYHHA